MSLSDFEGCGCSNPEPVENREYSAGQVDSQYCKNCDHMLAFTGTWKHFFSKLPAEVLCAWRKQ